MGGLFYGGVPSCWCFLFCLFNDDIAGRGQKKIQLGPGAPCFPGWAVSVAFCSLCLVLYGFCVSCFYGYGRLRLLVYSSTACAFRLARSRLIQVGALAIAAAAAAVSDDCIRLLPLIAMFDGWFVRVSESHYACIRTC